MKLFAVLQCILLSTAVVTAEAFAMTIDLYEAAKKGKPEILRQLLAGGADPNRLDKAGRTALHYAAEAGDTEAITILLNHKADINAQDSQFKETPLVKAAQYGQLSAAQLLLRQGAKVDTKNKFGYTALFAVVNNFGVAARRSSPTAVYNLIDLLNKRGADPNVRDQRGEGMLHMPAYQNETPLIAFLIKNIKTIEPNLKNNDGETVLDYACRGFGNEQLFDILLRAGFKPGEDYNRCLEGAVDQSKLLLVKRLLVLTKPNSFLLGKAAAGARADDESISLLLLQSGAAPNALSRTNLTPLHGAAMTNKKTLAVELIKRGARLNTNCSNAVFGSPLHFASRYGNPDIVQILLQLGAKVDEKNSLAETPLMLAIQGPIDYRPTDGPPPDWSKRQDYLKVIDLLVSKGADVRAKDQSNRSIMEVLAEVKDPQFRSKAQVSLSKHLH